MVSLQLQSGLDEGYWFVPVRGKISGFLRTTRAPKTKEIKERDDKVSRLQVAGGEPTTPTQGRQCRRSPELDWIVGANLCSCTSCPPSVPSHHESESSSRSQVKQGPSGLVVSRFRSGSASWRRSGGIEPALETWALMASVAPPSLEQPDHACDRRVQPTCQRRSAWQKANDGSGAPRRQSRCSR